ncbi:Atu4866 domain-containing protein [Kineococcus sp. SYSU DK018]|uniref:Atu4866 domain-containing protein n=1 Tax=Kineococcus sp. SYSU DK018 TaxID=3383139 RepID=UPI003D7D10E2
MPTTTAEQYLGMWVTEDGHIRHHMLPGGRYDEARGSREHAYTGSYRITGAHIDYADVTGFRADGDFVVDAEGHPVLLHAGMIMRRRDPEGPASAT